MGRRYCSQRRKFTLVLPFSSEDKRFTAISEQLQGLEVALLKHVHITHNLTTSNPIQSTSKLPKPPELVPSPHPPGYKILEQALGKLKPLRIMEIWTEGNGGPMGFLSLTVEGMPSYYSTFPSVSLSLF